MTAIRLHIGDFVTSKIDDEHVGIVTKTFDSTGITTKVKVSPIDALGVMEDKECRTSAWNRTPDDRKEKCIKSMIRNRKLFVESMCEVDKLRVSLKTNRRKNDEFAEQISNLKDENIIL